MQNDNTEAIDAPTSPVASDVPISKRTSKKQAKPRDDRGSIDIIDAVIGIAIFAAVIGLIGSQITSAGANLTAFPGASTLLYLVPLILVAVLILRLWKGKGRSNGHRY